MGRLTWSLGVAALVGSAVAVVAPPIARRAQAANDRFPVDMTVTPVLTGLSGGLAVAARFAPDGRIYVAFKEGLVRMYDEPGDTTPVTTLDLRTEVNSYHDRGLLGLALDPDFANGRPYVYVLYTYDLDPFATSVFPRWGDVCDSPPGGTTDGCVVSAQLARYTVGSDGVAASQSRVLLLDGSRLDTGGGWCNQFPSHSIGTVTFGADGMLYVGAGDGASYNEADYGQRGGFLPETPTPRNPCDDRDDEGNGRGDALQQASSRGGALRSQSVRDPAPSSDYQTWDGAILRIDPDTGAAPEDNPLVGGSPNDDRIVAYGLRNPYRFTVRPGTNEVRIGDVGWTRWEEINAFTAGPDQEAVPNFGWPCYEGPERPAGYDNLDVDLCESLYADPNGSIDGVSSPLTAPEYAWIRYSQASDTEPTIPCGNTGGGGSATGGQFASNPAWPADIRGAYVFGDYARPCIVAMALDANGDPDPSNVTPLVRNVGVIDIQVGPGGDIYYLDYMNSSLWRLRPIAGNVPPVASFTANPPSGPSLQVAFDASGSSDANEGEVLAYSWDLDGDGACDDASGVTTTRTYAGPGTVTVALCVTDGIEPVRTEQTIHPGQLPPVIEVATTSADGGGWAVGDTIAFAASAVDPDITPSGAALADTAYAWTVAIRHCETPSSCHTHVVEQRTGASGTIVVPDHEYYAAVRLTLTVTDGQGLTDSRVIDLAPRTSAVTVATEPSGIGVAAAASSGPSPLTAGFLEDGDAQLSVPPTALAGGQKLRFTSWSDDVSAPRVRTVPAPPGASTFTARFQPVVSVSSVTPASLDTAGLPAAVTVVSDVTDDVAADGMTTTLTGPNGATVSAPLNLVAGDPATGRWSGTVTLPADWPAGTTTVRVAAAGADAAAKWAMGSPIALTAPVDTGVHPPESGAEGFEPVAPLRVLDTRIGVGAPPSRVEAGGQRRVQITGLPGVPDGARAVVANVTAVHTAAAGYAAAFPCGAQPDVSNLNAGADETVANLATVPLDAAGGLCVATSVAADLLVDLAAVLVPGGDGYTGAPPQRVVDSRDGTGAEPRKARAGEVLTVPLADAAPPGASAVVANLTVTDPAAAGFLTAYPCGVDAPVASNLNFVAGQTVANAALTALPSDGSLCVVASTETNVIVDVTGWVHPDSGAPALFSPVRMIDTRSTAALPAGATLRIDTASLGAPAQAVGVVTNVTATQAADAGYLTVYPCAGGRPSTSNVNFGRGRDRPGLAIGAIDANGDLCVFTSAAVDVIVDVQGWILR